MFKVDHANKSAVCCKNSKKIMYIPLTEMKRNNLSYCFLVLKGQFRLKCRVFMIMVRSLLLP